MTGARRFTIMARGADPEPPPAGGSPMPPARSEEMPFAVREAHWPGDAQAVRRIREAVFVREQGVPAAIEQDGRDGDCAHVLAESAAGDAIGTARLLPDGRIGRMAVLPAWRSRGVGRALLARLLEVAAARGLDEVFLHAQRPVVGFYERLGFRSEGEEFLEAGIPHRRMRLASGAGGP